MTTKTELLISEARANLTDVVSRVRLLRQTVFLMNRKTAVAAVVPIELGKLIRRTGGADQAAAILAAHLDRTPAGEPDDA